MRRSFGFVFGVGIALAGCRRAPPPSSALPLVAAQPASDAIVATVDGRPIRASDVAIQARAASETATQALSDLIDAEALVGEAARQHLDRDPAVRAAARHESVRRLFATDFEPSAGPSAIPDRAVRAAYQQNRALFDHDEQVEVWHILVPLPKQASPELRKAALATAQEIARRARGSSPDAFQALAQAVKPPAGIAPLRLEHLVTAENGWTVPAFSHAAFTLTHPGDTTGVVETSYGFHVIYLVRRIPPRHESEAAADAEVRSHLLDEFRKAELEKYVERARQRHRVAVYPDHLPRTDEAPALP